MNASKIFLALALMLLTSIHVQATVPSGDLANQYFAKRYVKFVYSGADYKVDLNQVQSMIQNTHNHMKDLYNVPDTWYGSHTIFVLFKSGNLLYFDNRATQPKPTEAWNDYTEFLRVNPQFLSIP